jgi:lipoprotein-releasing system ATP-binding protein
MDPQPRDSTAAPNAARGTAPVLLRASGLVKEFRTGDVTLQVLKGIDVEVRRGEFLAIAGPSGAGKSTLLHCLGFLDRPTAGDVTYGAVRAAGLDDVRLAEIRNRHFGFVFQLYHLLPDLTALENVLVPLMIQVTAWTWPARRGAFRQRAMELLDRLGLAARLHHRPAQLSGGERQRVAIARALVNEPDVVLCDEPTGNLDMATSRQIQEVLVGLHRDEGRTLVIVTHDEGVARRADRVIHLVDGRIA